MPDIFYYTGIVYIIHKIIEIYVIGRPDGTTRLDISKLREMDLAQISDSFNDAKTKMNKSLFSNILGGLLFIWTCIGIFKCDEYLLFVSLIVMNLIYPYLFVFLAFISVKKQIQDLSQEQTKEMENHSLKMHITKYVLQITAVVIILVNHFIL